MRKFWTNGSKIEALANLLATNNIYKRFLKDLLLKTTDMCQVGWKHAPLFITGNRGGVSSVEKVIIMLICLSSVNWQVLKILSTLSDKLKSIHAEIHVQKWTDTFTRMLQKKRKPMKNKMSFWQCPIWDTSDCQFICNNDSYILIFKDMCIKQQEGAKIFV